MTDRLRSQPSSATEDAYGVTEFDRDFAARIIEDFGDFEEGITNHGKLAQWVRNIRWKVTNRFPDQSRSSPANAQDFDAMCDLFTGHASVVANWKHSYFGAAYSTRLKAAIAEMKYAIAEAEKHPEIRPDAAATAQEVADLRCLVATYANEATEAKAEIERLRTQATGVQENWAIFDQAMNMLADVPGGTMLERITRLKEWYQQLCGTHAQRADTSADVSSTKDSK